MAKPKRTKNSLRLHPEGYSYAALRPLVLATLRAGISTLVRGHPGVGKSSLAAELAAEMGLPLHDIRLAQRDPAELAGVYFPDHDNRQLALYPPAWVRQVCDAPGFVFLDEINAAVTRLHQAAAYQLVLERRLGPFDFHPDTVVMAAGNLEEDNAIVVPLSSALNNRFAHYTMSVDLPDWLTWAAGAGIAPEIIAYFRANERFGATHLYDNDGSEAFASPRSWEMASRLFQAAAGPHRRRAIAGCVGAKATGRFLSFLDLYERVDPARIVGRGKAVDFSSRRNSDPSFMHATVAAVANWVVNQPDFDPSWAPHVATFLASKGLDPEYAFVFLRTLHRHGRVTDHLRHDPGYRRLASDLVQLHVGLYQ